MGTTYLGQYTDDHAEDIAAALDEAGIGHWEKQSGTIVRFLSAADWGTRLFVDENRLGEAETIADRVLDRHQDD